VHSAVNILGLAIGMACCILILLLVQHEFSSNRFHTQADRIYRLVRETHKPEGSASVNQGTSGALAPALLNEFPDIQQAVRLWITEARVRANQKDFKQVFCLADKSFGEVFTFPLAKGNWQTALHDPSSAVITEQMAQLYFGNENPIGKTIIVEHWHLEENTYTVTGVIADLPGHSTLQFACLATAVSGEIANRHWRTWVPIHIWRPIETYALLSEGSDASGLEKKLPDLMTRHMGEKVSAQNTYHLQPLHRIHLYSGVDYDLKSDGDIHQIYLLSVIAFAILLIACINFMNLSTARSAARCQEIGVRKIVGAHRRQLIFQFLGESLLLAFTGLLLASTLVELALPVFNDFTGKHLSLIENTNAAPALIGLVLIVGLLAGSYPAFFLSGFQPATVFKGGLTTGVQHVWFRKGLVVFQFAISILLIIGTLAVHRQLDYIRAKELGFDKENIIRIPIFEISRESGEMRKWLYRDYITVKQAFANHPNILDAAAYRYPLSYGGNMRTFRADEDAEWKMRMQEIDENFLGLFGIELITGRTFSNEIATDYRKGFILNETAVKQLSWTSESAIGKPFQWVDETREGTVIGVVKDFHFRPLHEKIGPLAMIMRTVLFRYVGLMVQTENLPATLDFLKETWHRFLPDRPFQFAFVDEAMSEGYLAEIRLSQIYTTFSLLAIFVACLGLFALASYTAEQRTKEIGIRKVLGASMPDILLLLSKEFMKLVLMAI
jgi:putative ABC transport system permease protein